jgi:hypothetical protein
MKGVALPDDFMDVIKDFLGVDRHCHVAPTTRKPWT